MFIDAFPESNAIMVVSSVVPGNVPSIEVSSYYDLCEMV